MISNKSALTARLIGITIGAIVGFCMLTAGSLATKVILCAVIAALAYSFVYMLYRRAEGKVVK